MESEIKSVFPTLAEQLAGKLQSLATVANFTAAVLKSQKKVFT